VEDDARKAGLAQLVVNKVKSLSGERTSIPLGNHAKAADKSLNEHGFQWIAEFDLRKDQASLGGWT